MSLMSTGRRPGAAAHRPSPGDAYSLPRQPGAAGSKLTAGRRPARPRLRLVPPLPTGPAAGRPSAPPRGRISAPADARVPAPRAVSVSPATPVAVSPAATVAVPPADTVAVPPAATVPASPAATVAAPAAPPAARMAGPAAPAATPVAAPAVPPARPTRRGGQPARPTRRGGTPARPARPGGGPARIVRPAAAPARRGQPRRKVRLTRRGRVVVWVLAALVAAAVLTPVWLIAAGGAQAANHGLPAATVHAGMRHVVVQPGQTLWSIAMAAEPAADPRVVTQEIMQFNALSSGVVVPGESLWVPAG